MNDRKLLAAFTLLAASHDSRDEAATAILDAIVTVYTPEQFGEAFDSLVKLPEPFESWDDKAASWLYAKVFDLLDSIDFNRDPDKIAARAWRKAEGLSQAESAAVALLLERSDGSVKATAAVHRLVRLNRRELKRRDPVWLFKQALKHATHPEAIESGRRALAFETRGGK